jgi:queuine tRNA-ribosyltransferase
VKDEVGYIRDMASGEVMHLGTDPEQEARSLYVEQSRLVARLQVPADEPLVVWDVGLGAAANAMAAILAAENLSAAGSIARPLLLVSFENDLDSLKLALDHPGWFKHLRHAAPRALLAQDRWLNATASIEWRLLRGDFAALKFDAPPPDVIFFDPFSFRTDAALWTQPAFRELAKCCAQKPMELFTYTYSTSVRAAMLAAGFYVAKGRGTGPKAETTVCLSPPAATGAHGFELLGEEWLAKWRRSDAQAPFGSMAGDDSWHQAVLVHPQFR